MNEPVKSPPRYNVMIVNDDKTSFGEVVDVVSRILKCSDHYALELAKKAEREGEYPIFMDVELNLALKRKLFWLYSWSIPVRLVQVGGDKLAVEHLPSITFRNPVPDIDLDK